MGITADFPPHDTLTCDPRTLMPFAISGLLEGPNAFDIHHPDSPAILHALAAAEHRWMHIDEHGDEHPHQPGDEVYTPNWVTSYEVHPGLVRAAIDSKGVHYPRMYRTILHITREELRRAGITGAHLAPPPPD